MSEFSGLRAGDPRTRRIEAGIMLAGLAAFTLLYNTQAILPYFTRNYGISPAAAAMSVSISTAGVGVGLIAAVPISERMGRVQLIRWSIVLAGILGTVVVFISDWNMFLVARFVMGFMVAGLPATAAVYLREEIHPSIVSSVIGIHIFGNTLGGLGSRIVPSTVIQLMSQFGVTRLVGLDTAHAAMFVAALVGLASAVGCFFLLPPAEGFVQHRDSFGVLVRKFGRAFRDPVLLGLYVIGYLGVGSFIGALNVMGFRLEQAPYFVPIGLIGLMYFVYPVAGWASAIAGKIADKTSLRTVMVVAPMIGLTGVGLLATPNLWLIVLGLTVMAIGFFVGHSTAASWVAGRAMRSVEVPAQAASIYMVCFYLGSSVTGNVTPMAWSAMRWPGVTMVIGTQMTILLIMAVILSRTKMVTGRSVIGRAQEN